MSVDPGGGEAQKPDLKEIVTDLTQQTAMLVGQELELLKAELDQRTDLLKHELELTTNQSRMEIDAAKAEVTEAAKQAGIGAGLFGAAGLVGLAAFGTATAAFVALLASFIPVWLSALVVTVAYGVLAGGLAWVGRSKIEQLDIPIPGTVDRIKALLMRSKNRVQHEVSPMPVRTVESLKAAKQDLSQAWRGGQTPAASEDSSGRVGSA